MVSLEELLARVNQAETEADRQWILLELQLAQMPEDLVSMLWAAAVPHWFDGAILAALRPELAERAEELYEQLQELTFIEEFAGRGHNVHELTRDVLLGKLWAERREEFLELSRRAADYFFGLDGDGDAEVEACYHEVLNEGEAQTGRLLDRAIHWASYRQLDRLEAVIFNLSEHQKKQHLDDFGNAFSLHLQAYLADASARYEQEFELLKAARSAYETNQNCDRYLAALLNDLGGSYQTRGKYDSAEPLYQRALDIHERQLGADHPHTARSLNNLANLYYSQGKYESAEPLYQRALDIYERQLGIDHPHTATSLNNLANLYESQGKYESAEPLYQRALDICERQLGADHPYTATSLNNLAALYQSQWKYESAEPLYQSALDMRERQLGADHPDTAASLNNLAALYQSQGKYESAEPLYQRALDIRERQLGADHPHTAISLSNLADLYQTQKRYTEAIPLWERWRSIKLQRNEARNPNFATTTRNLAQLYEQCKQYPEALQNYEAALSMFRDQFGAKHPQTILIQGKIKQIQKQIKQQKKSKS
jgi:tetratricopeptide (TPR) repeat protein